MTTLHIFSEDIEPNIIPQAADQYGGRSQQLNGPTEESIEENMLRHAANMTHSTSNSQSNAIRNARNYITDLPRVSRQENTIFDNIIVKSRCININNDEITNNLRTRIQYYTERHNPNATMLCETLPMEYIQRGRKKFNAVSIWTYVQTFNGNSDQNTRNYAMRRSNYIYDMIKKWTEKQQQSDTKYAMPHIVNHDTNTELSTDEKEALPANSIIFGGKFDNEDPVYIKPIHSTRYRGYGLSNAARAAQHPIGFIPVQHTNQHGEEKTLYWFAGIVPANAGTMLAIARTIAHIAEHPDPMSITIERLYPEVEYIPAEIEFLIQQQENQLSQKSLITTQKTRNEQQNVQKEAEYDKTWKAYQLLKRSEDNTNIAQAKLDITNMMSIDGVEHIDIDERTNTLYVYTKELTARATGRQSSGRNWKEINVGHFAIALKLGKKQPEIRSFQEGTIRVRNMSRMIIPPRSGQMSREIQAPHIRPFPCWGNIDSTLSQLYAQRAYPEIIMMIIMYLQSYNETDGWGQGATCWPSAEKVQQMWAVRKK